MDPTAQLLWDKIRNPNCTDCELHESAQSVCLIGVGPVPADIMVIGEAPGFREDDVQRPFSGRAGKLLDTELERVGIKREDIFVTNVAKCRPPENRTPKRGEIKACSPYLEQEIEAVKPKFILTVGNSALQVIKKSGIMKHRGEVYQLDDALVFPTVHPAAVLRNPRYEQLFRTDLATFSRLIRGVKGTKPPRTFLIQDKHGLTVMLQAIMRSKAVAYDFETNGFNEFSEDPRVATIAVATSPDIVFVAPVHHIESTWKDAERVLGAIGRAMLYSPARIIAHNSKFDDRWFNRFGVPLHSDFDTMQAAHLLDENRFKGLKPLAQMVLGVDPWKDIDFNKENALEVPLRRLARYNAKDAAYTLQLYYVFREELMKPENGRSLRLMTKLIMPASKALTTIEQNGMWIDQERLADRRLRVQRRLEKINRRLTKLAGMEANWNSPVQVGEILFEKLKLPMFDVTAGGKPSTKESVLLRLKHEHEFPALLLDWRKLSKWQSTYLERWANETDANGRIHPNYKIAGTVTGRLASGKDEGRKDGLGIQQVPRDPFIRSIIGAPEGWSFVEADFAQIELRIAAHYAQDPTLMHIFRTGGDPHMTMAMALTNKPSEHVTKEERKKAKSVNFGFLFGMGAAHYIDYARDNYELVVSLPEARSARKRFFDGYRKLAPWHDRQRRLVNRNHRVQSLVGRVRHLPDVLSEDKEVRAEAERQAINSPVQGLASDFLLLAMVLLDERIDPEEIRIVGTVHDSMMFEIRNDVVDKWVAIIRKTMENLPLKRKFGATFSVPVKVDITVGSHWGGE